MAMSFLDAVRNTLNDFAPESDFVPYLSLHRWLVGDEIFKNSEDQVGGFEHEFRIGYKEGASTKFVAPASVRNPTITEYTVMAKFPLITSYFEVAYVEREMLAQRGNGPAGAQAKKLVDVIKRRRQAEQLGYYKAQEEKFFKLPTSTLDPYGLPYHIVPITSDQVTAGTGAGAFQGANAAGQSAWCGIDRSSATYAGIRNWNANFNGATNAFTMNAENKKRIARMFRQLNFVGPMNVADLKLPAFSKFRIITDQYNIEQFEATAVSQNDQLGNVVLAHMGTGLTLRSANNGVIVNGLPVLWADILDTYDASRGYHPLYMLNTEFITTVKDPACWMKKRPAASDGVHQPDVLVEYIDSLFNYKCRQPRYAGGVISWVAAE
jgi:hypothetical protein